MPPTETITQDNPAPHTPPTANGSHTPKRPFSKLSFPKKFSRQQLLIFAAAFALIGAFFIFRSFAAVQESGSLEAERMTRPAGTELVSDSNASAGQALLLRTNGTATTNLLSLSNPATQLTIRAKGAQCGGAPQMLLTIDGQLVQSTPTPVPATSWSNYTLPVNLASGSHTMSLDFNNDNVEYKGGSGKIRCSRDLYVDKFTFYRDDGVVVTPAPTASLTANPTTVTSGATSTLSWSSTNATSCTASGSWTGTKATSGTETTAALTANATYSLSCTGTGGTGSGSVTVTVSGGTAASSIYWGARIDGETYGKGTLGDAPWDYSSWDTFEQHTGKKISMLHWGQPAPWLQAFSTDPFNKTIARGAIPLVSMATPDSVLLADITAGKYDASITNWAIAAKNYGKPFILRWNWEMNGTWYGYSKQVIAANNPKLYTDAWQHWHTLVKNQGASNVTWAWCPNVVYPGSIDIASLYPGDAYVDWACIDGYNFGNNPLKPAGWKSFTQVYQETYNAVNSLAPTKPIVIAEIGSTEICDPAKQPCTTKAAWITDALKQLPTNFPKIKALVWFNWNIVENGGRWDWQIESSASAQSAFAAGIASPYYAPGGSFGSLPPLTKVQPLP